MSRRLQISALAVAIDVVVPDDCMSDEQWDELSSAWVDARRTGTASGIVSEPDITLTAGLYRTDPAQPLLPRAVYDITASSLDRLAQAITVKVTLAALEAQGGRLLLLHAGAVALPDGTTVAFVGPSGRGKTTAMRALSEHLGYVSDESVGIDSDLSVVPYRKPLSIIEPNSPPHQPKRQVAVSSLGQKPGTRGQLPDAPLILRRIVLLNRIPADDSGEHLSHPVIEAVDLVEALTDLLPQTSYLRRTPRALQFITRIIDATGGVLRITYQDATRLHTSIDDILNTPGLPTKWTPLAGAPLSTEATDSPLTLSTKRSESAADPTSQSMPDINLHTRVKALPAADAIDVGSDVLVFAAGTVHHLSGLGEFLWQELAAPQSVSELTGRAVAEFGSPGDADAQQLVCAALVDLHAAQLVQILDAEPSTMSSVDSPT